MKQQNSYHRLYFHLVFSTRNRERLILSPADGQMLLELFLVKAHDLDSYIEEFGCWRDHVHLLVRIPAKLALAKVYGQLKGFSAFVWNRRNQDRPLFWQKGMFSITVDPDHCDELRHYIRHQWRHHDSGSVVSRWETPDTGPEGLPLEIPSTGAQ